MFVFWLGTLGTKAVPVPAKAPAPAMPAPQPAGGS